MKKKIALIGNNGNWNFALMRWLRDAGYEAQLFYPNYFSGFYPFTDTVTLKWKPYCHEINWIRKGFPPSEDTINEIKSTLNGFDFIITNGYEAGLLNFSGIISDIYIIFGHDLFLNSFKKQEYSFFEKLYYILNPKRNYNSIKYGTFDKQIRQSIVTAKNVILENTNEDYEAPLKKLNIKGIRHFFTPPYVYYPDYFEHFNNKLTPATHWYREIDNIRISFNFIILYHGSQHWKTHLNSFPKNPDYLIKGFANFIKNSSTKISSHLILIERGDDINESKRLINELDIEDYVTWLPSMDRKDIMYLISQCDLCCGEFGESFFSFGTIVEAMLMGKPVLHHRKDELYLNNYDDLYPLLNAKYPEEIASILLEFYDKPHELEKIGLDAQKWCKLHFVETPLKKIIDLIEI